MEKQENEVVLIWFAPNDAITNNIRVSDQPDRKLRKLIIEVAKHAFNDDEEIYEEGDTYLITEKGTYLACYADEITDLNEIPKESDERNSEG
jgi:hypothetical protein